MKRIIALLLLVLAFALSGCDNTPEKELVQFYYPRAATAYGSADSVIASEARETYGHREDPEYLLRLYLGGPADSALRSPFPRNIRLLSLTQTGKQLEITLSDSFSALSSLERNLAGVSLGLTCRELCGAEAIQIFTETGAERGEKPIVLDLEGLLLLDEAYTPLPEGGETTTP